MGGQKELPATEQGLQVLDPREAELIKSAVDHYLANNSPIANDVASLLLRRVSRKDIVDLITKDHKVDVTTVYRVIRNILKGWAGEAKEQKDLLFGRAVAFREELIKQALAKDNLRFAWEVQKDLDELSGVYQKEESRDYNIVIKTGIAAKSDDGPVEKELLNVYQETQRRGEEDRKEEGVLDAEFTEDSESVLP